MDYKKILNEFEAWCSERSEGIDGYTSEFTIQFRLAIFLYEFLEPRGKIELEVNIEKYGLAVKDFAKKEIDIVFTTDAGERHAFEIKYLRDRGTFNIGMYEVCKDVLFLEQLKDSKEFESTCALVLTTMPDMYFPKGKVRVANEENLALYNRFREERHLYGCVAIKTGSKDESLTLSRKHKFEWSTFGDDAQATIIHEC